MQRLAGQGDIYIRPTYPFVVQVYMYMLSELLWDILGELNFLRMIVVTTII